MKNHLTHANMLTKAALAALILLAGAGVALAANDKLGASQQPTEFTWSAELVAFDEASGMATVKAFVVGSPIDNADTFDKGDAIVLAWSGAYKRASGVRSIAHGDMARDRFEMPVEFVSTERDGRYLVFRVPISEAHVAAVEKLSPGLWVTATSPHAAPDRTAVVSTIRSYTDIG